jgi:hypothetical protein
MIWFNLSWKDLIEPAINTLHEITLNLSPAWNTGKVHTKFYFFYSLILSKKSKALW